MTDKNSGGTPHSQDEAALPAGRDPRKQGYDSHVALNIIHRCNSRCVFCFEGSRAKLHTPDTREVFTLVDEVSQHANAVVFMGGEAIIRKDIVEILAHARDRGLASTLFTNGLGLAKDGLLRACAEAGLQGLHVSVNAWDRESWARTANLPQKTFDKFLKALDNLRAHFQGDQPRLWDVNFHVLPFAWNVEHLEDIVEFILARVFNVTEPGKETDLPVRPYFLFKVFTLSRELAKTSPELMPAYRDLLPAFRSLVKNKGDVAKITFWGIPLCLIPDLEDRSEDLQQLVRNIKICSNFEDQADIELMDFTNWQDLPVETSSLCATCSLLGICYGPGSAFTWGEVPPPEFLPMPSTRNPVAILEKMGIPLEEAAALIKAREATIQASIADSPPPDKRPGFKQSRDDDSGDGTGPREEQQARVEAAAPTPEPTRLARMVSFGLSHILEQAPVEGYTLAGVQDVAAADLPTVRIIFSQAGSEKSFQVDVELKDIDRRYVAETLSHGLRFRKDSPPRTQAQRTLLKYVYHCIIEYEKAVKE